jgi:hypothetical protein
MRPRGVAACGARAGSRRSTVCSRSLHNILTRRGTVVRDPHGWAGYLDEAIGLFAGDADVLFAQHHWPRWGTDRIVDFLATQRDLYGYIHNQTAVYPPGDPVAVRMTGADARANLGS